MLFLLLVLAVGSVDGGDDFKAARRELETAIDARNPKADREAAVVRIGTFEGKEPTELLIQALEESVSEQQSLDKVFAVMTEELSDLLDGTVDVRLVGQGKQQELEKRREIGRRVILEAEVCDKILEVLGGRTDDASVELVAKILKRERDWRMQSRLMETLGKMGSDKALPVLHDLLEERDARVRMFASESVGRIASPDSVEALAPLLEDKEWQVRAFAIEAMGRIGEHTRLVVPHLINALSQETGRLQHELSEMLELRTGQKHGLEPGPWQRWWTEEGEAFLGSTEAVAAPKVSAKTAKQKDDGFYYYGIKTKSDKVMFILDVSDSMNDDAEETVLPADGIPKRTGNLRPKIQVARENLVQAILDLPEDATFNIIAYNKYVSAWQPKMVKAHKRNKNDAFEYVMGLKATEATNIFDALELSFKFAGRYLTDKHYASPVDTIFFLTDGKATEGRIQDTEQILAEVKRINRIGKITIHTIGIGYLHDRDFLKSLAEQNGGKYVNAQ